MSSHSTRPSLAQATEIAATTALVRMIGAEAERFRDVRDPLVALRTAYRDLRILNDEREKLGLRRHP